MNVTGIGNTEMLDSIRKYNNLCEEVSLVDIKLDNGEPVPIQEILRSGNQDNKDIANSFIANIKSGIGKLCACIGPMYGEPFCPCSMERQGLPMDGPIRKAAEEKSKKDWDWLCRSGGFFDKMEAEDDLLYENLSDN